ncbi:twin-arginine translocase subunit TatC [Candidatus Pantoea edessiphila]|uniref:Sec-independent protein translocase protein TatC n=1 Tax=Candidatus Pantoea edessiphila TaxID=2044610 RepID=A0A2P5SXG3_9GAMM|nr:twin-arginine translocase subunit TatC [Candidatus Pantoea edessiphila]MBK4775929.1 twin-arginine translocase subunit TatC [Pantoea sp. Edef]PPI86993.1 twin-arginine translocase subunit TatC [Candidatus Pantoea edessiphila]
MIIENNQLFIDHLIELRKRILNCIITVFIIFLMLVYFANDIYSLVALPLIHQMPSGATMIATEVAAPFIIPIKLTFILSIFIAVPIITYQVWAFIAPALHKCERNLLIPMAICGTLLFYIGVIFAYYFILPMAFKFFIKALPKGVTIATDITHYLDFVIWLFMVCGISFEIPIAIMFLCWIGVTNSEKIKNNRPYVFVGTFIIGMLLTPDVLSQTILAISLYFLFEIGLFFSHNYLKKINR